MTFLDTSAIIDFLKGVPEVVREVERHKKDMDTLSASSIALYELLKYENPEGRGRVIEFVSGLSICSFDALASGIAAREFLMLKSKGTQLNEFDILISAVAEAKGEILLTTDKGFRRLGNSNIQVIE